MNVDATENDVLAALTVRISEDGAIRARLDGMIPSDLVMAFLMYLDKAEIALMDFDTPFDAKEVSERLSDVRMPVKDFPHRIANG